MVVMPWLSLALHRRHTSICCIASRREREREVSSERVCNQDQERPRECCAAYAILEHQGPHLLTELELRWLGDLDAVVLVADHNDGRARVGVLDQWNPLRFDGRKGLAPAPQQYRVRETTREREREPISQPASETRLEDGGIGVD